MKKKKIDSILDEGKPLVKVAPALLKRLFAAKAAFEHAKEEVTLAQVAYARAMREALASVDAPDDMGIERDGTVVPVKKGGE